MNRRWLRVFVLLLSMSLAPIDGHAMRPIFQASQRLSFFAHAFWFIRPTLFTMRTVLSRAAHFNYAQSVIDVAHEAVNAAAGEESGEAAIQVVGFLWDLLDEAR